MTQSATDFGLSPEKAAALECLLAGGSVIDAAAAAGVSRSTLHRWLKDDFELQAALNGGRRLITGAVAPRLIALADAAVDTIAKAVRDGDSKIALEMLKGLGLLTGSLPHIGPDDPRILEEEVELAESTAANLRELRKMLVRPTA